MKKNYLLSMNWFALALLLLPAIYYFLGIRVYIQTLRKNKVEKYNS